jgi:hypothetical protein
MGPARRRFHGAQSSAQFNAPIRSTGNWLITGSATFNGATVELLGPVTLRGGRLVLNSPVETRVPDLRLEVEPSFGGGNLIGGSGLLFSGSRAPGAIPSSSSTLVRVRLDAPTTVATNFTVSEEAQVDLMADTQWTGGSVSGNLRIAHQCGVRSRRTTQRPLCGCRFPRRAFCARPAPETCPCNGSARVPWEAATA